MTSVFPEDPCGSLSCKVIMSQLLDFLWLLKNTNELWSHAKSVGTNQKQQNFERFQFKKNFVTLDRAQSQ